MKRSLLITILVILLFGASAFASNNEQIVAKKVQYPIKVNGVQITNELSMVNIKDRVYLPISSLCEVLGIEVKWNKEEGAVEILSDKKQENEIDLDINQDAAIKIADAVFGQKFGEEFLKDTKVSVEETEDGKCFVICRYNELTLGGDYTLYISKADGKVTKIVAGE